jgi:hypothetical protein
MSRRSPPLSLLRRAVEAANNIRWRHPTVPHLRVTTAPRQSGTAWFITPDWNRPSGGIRKHYRCVDVLNAAGISAAVVHHSKRFRCDWFSNETRVVAAREVTVSSTDVIIVPEIYGASICTLPAGVRQVILNQNVYVTLPYLASGALDATAPYLDNPNLVAVAAVSDQNAELLRYAFPELTVHRIRWSLDPELYYPAAGLPGRRLSFMPRRRADDSAQVIALLRLRGVLDGWEVEGIADRTESEVARIMRSCRLFLSFSEREGLGLPPLEAIACGCLVVGFTGYAGVEYFRHPFATAVEDGDIGMFASAVERLLAWTEGDPLAARTAALDGARFVRETYSPQVEQHDLLSLFGTLLQ